MTPRPPRRMLARLRASEDGAVTIPTLFWMPLFVMLMAASVEMGALIFKQTMFDRGLENSVRILRLGIEPMPSHDELKRSICNNMAIIKDCMPNLTVEVVPVNKTTWTSERPGKVMCTDWEGKLEADPMVKRGASNQLILVRACLKVKPMMGRWSPSNMTNPLAATLHRDASGKIALISLSAFINEPME